ncbi:MAG: hypothetical protein AAGL49_11725, partial [Pseudomonadota bacterium]
AGYASLLGTEGLLYIAVGLLYAGCLTFGTLIYLDTNENSYTVPVNRGSSLLAGAVATIGLSHLFQEPAPSSEMLFSSGLVILGFAVLAVQTRSRA